MPPLPSQHGIDRGNRDGAQPYAAERLGLGGLSGCQPDAAQSAVQFQRQLG